MNNRFIYKLTSHYLPKTIGNKAIHLRRLLDLGVQVPETYICNWDAYCEYLIQGEGVLKPLSQELSKVINLDVSYAVRSSANVEDTHDNSYAGQFTSTLNVRGMDELINAVRLVWESSESDVLRAYQEKSSGNVVDLKMAVIIQRMVFPVLSGVVFSRNPVTGMDEIVIEAVKGLGTALMQDGITPLRWVNK